MMVITGFSDAEGHGKAGDLVYQRVQPSSTHGLFETTDTSMILHQLTQRLEFCYNIRYFELNGRGRGNPWSLRQTGVYQKWLSNKRSAWLLLNFSSYVSDRVAAALGEESSPTQGSCEASLLSPHLFILFAATRNWRQYIENSRQKVGIFVRLPMFPV